MPIAGHSTSTTRIRESRITILLYDMAMFPFQTHLLVLHDGRTEVIMSIKLMMREEKNAQYCTVFVSF